MTSELERYLRRPNVMADVLAMIATIHRDSRAYNSRPFRIVVNGNQWRLATVREVIAYNWDQDSAAEFAPLSIGGEWYLYDGPVS